MAATAFSTGDSDATGTSYVLQEALSAYTDEAYTNAKKLSGTGIVSSGNAGIDTSTETYSGQMRWRQPIAKVVNVPSLSSSTPGSYANYGTDFLKYIKTVRTHGANQINVKQVITQEDGLAKIARDFAETRAQDEHDAIMAILRGVAIAEGINGAAAGGGGTGTGGQDWDSDPTDKKFGFYVDLESATTHTDAPLITNVGQDSTGTANPGYVGAQRAEAMLEAFGMAFKDYEPDWCYLVTSPKVMASFRSANLVDNDRITEGNIDFQTIFNGKFRLIPTRASQNLTSTELTKINGGAGEDFSGTDLSTTFLVLPGAIAMEPLMVPVPFEIDRTANAYGGSGTHEIWYRWGYIAHPKGYDWKGGTDAFATDANYYDVNENGTVKTLAAATAGLANTTGVWDRKTSSALSLGILPIFHL